MELEFKPRATPRLRSLPFCSGMRLGVCVWGGGGLGGGMRPKGRKGRQCLSLSLQCFGNPLPIVRGALDIFLWWREDVGSLSTWRFERRTYAASGYRKPDRPPRHSLWLHLRSCSFTYELSAPACILPTSQSYPDSLAEVVKGTQGLAAICVR